MPRRRARCFRRRSRMLLSSGLASSTTSPRRIDLAAHVRDLALERRGGSTIAPRRGNAARARRMPVTVASTDARNVASPSRCSGSSARPSTASAAEDRVELRGRPQRDLAGAREEPRRLRRSSRARTRPRARRSADAGARASAPGGVCASRQTAVHDAIEFEGLEGAGLHGIRGLRSPRAQSASIVGIWKLGNVSGFPNSDSRLPESI